jgi:hypothetical protein
MKNIIATLAILTVTTCVFGQTRKTLDSWFGHSKKDLLNSWGLPEKEGGDGEGGTIVAYRTSDFRGEKWTSFNLNSDNVVTGWSTNPIPPTTINVISKPTGFGTFKSTGH